MPDGEDFIIYADIDRREQYLISLALEDIISIARMCDHMRKMSTIEMFEDPAFRRGVIDYARFMVKSGPALRLFMKYGKMPLADYFKKLGFKNEYLKNRLLTIANGMEDFSAIAFLFTLLWFSQKNAGYPLGGSMPFTLLMAEKYRSLGGVFTGKSRVEKIIIDGDRVVGVRMADGSLKYADYIIGACDLHTLIYDMLDCHLLHSRANGSFRRSPKKIRRNSR